MSDTPTPSELEVKFKPETGKAVIEGKTAVPFQSFVQLILQRKVQNLFKQWGKNAVIVDSELLTGLASAPQDSHENRSKLIMATLGIGIIAGVALFAAIQLILLFAQYPVGMKELAIILGVIVAAALLLLVIIKAQKMPKGEKFAEVIEDVASFLSK